MDAYVAGDQVAQWSPDGRVAFVTPQAYIRQPSEGFIRFESGTLTMEVSPNHRVPHYNWDGQFQVKTAAQIAAKISRRKIPTTFDVTGLPGLDMSDDMIRFAVMMHADGNYPAKGKQGIIVVRKERKKARIRMLLGVLGIAFKEAVSPKRPTETRFSFLPPYRGKRFSGEWWNASPHQLAIILDEIGYWDGLYGYEETRYFSAVQGDADFIQYAAHACGRRASITVKKYPDKPNWKPTYIVQIRPANSYKNTATLRSETIVTRTASSDGKQYCFTVPSGFFVVRHEGSIFVTGNSGKSSGCVVEIIRRAQAQKPGPDGIRRTRWAAIRNTFRQLDDTTIRTVFQWLPPEYFGKYYVNDHRYVIKAFEGCEFEILFRALDRPDDVKNLLSLELTGAWVNEAREIPWSIIDALCGRVGRFPAMVDGGPTWHGVWLDTNPPDADSKFYKFFEERDWLAGFEAARATGKLPPGVNKPEDYAQIWHQPSGMSPEAENMNNLTPGYYQRLALGKSPEWIKVYVEGKYGFVMDGKPVYPEYNDQVHTKAVEPRHGLTVYRGWDFGLTPVCTFHQLLPDGRWLIFDELVSENIDPKGMGIDRFSDNVLDHCVRAFPKNTVFEDIGDPAGQQRAQTDEKTVFQILQAKGIKIEPGEQTLALRLEAVRKPLNSLRGGEPQFILHPRCKVARKGFMGGYHYRRLQTSQERFTDQPDKTHPISDVQDSIQYVATRLFGDVLTRGAGMDDQNWHGVTYYTPEPSGNTSTGYG